jgi:hypothetical protein
MYSGKIAVPPGGGGIRKPNIQGALFNCEHSPYVQSWPAPLNLCCIQTVQFAITRLPTYTSTFFKFSKCNITLLFKYFYNVIKND